MSGEVAVRSEFALLAELARDGTLTSTALHLDPETRYETWEALGTMLGLLHRSACWLIGDWLAFGETAYGERYAQGAAATGLAEQTLMNYASVARRIPPERRLASVSFSAHALVAPLEPREQAKWLKRAEKEDWSRRELDAALKGDLPPGGDPPPPQSIRRVARTLWTSSKRVPGGYFVPEGPMQALREALEAVAA